MTRLPGHAGLVVLLTGSGLLHFLAPVPFRRIIPEPLAFGHANGIVLLSGLFELGCAGALLSRRTRRAGGWATAAFFVAVFPANLKMALDTGLPWRSAVSPARAVVAWLRLPLQVPLILWARSIALK